MLRPVGSQRVGHTRATEQPHIHREVVSLGGASEGGQGTREGSGEAPKARVREWAPGPSK